MIKNTRKFVFTVLGILFFLNILTWIAVFELAKPKFLEVNFFNVGQGDAIFIETPQRHQILIDGGPNSTILEKLSKEMPFWDRTIDLIILTHPDKDHLAGLIEVLKRYKVENILWTGVLKDSAEFKEWQKLIKKEGVSSTAFLFFKVPQTKITIAQSGQKIKWQGANSFSYIEILYPFKNLEGKNVKNINNTSIISRLVFGETSFLFTGDAYKSVEKELIQKYSCLDLCKSVSINSDVLKVGHQGSRTSTSEKFLTEVSPKIAVISVGKENRYGHPHSEVLKILEKYGIKILRTDLDGDIKIFSDGKSLKIKNKK